MQLTQVLGTITRHPLNAGRPLAAISRFVQWQLRSRLARRPLQVSWVKDIQMWVRRGETGLTGNIYCGLVEYADMAFLLHFLRPDDLFMDIGGNAGAYTLLAVKGNDARAITVEPHPETFERLTANLKLNDVGDRVDAYQLAVGDQVGQVQLSKGLDVTNHVLDGDEGGIPVKMETVDNLISQAGGQPPILMKVDVEGFEWSVLEGAHDLLRNQGLEAIIIESAGHGSRYGHGDDELHLRIINAGFQAVQYDPPTRSLTPRDAMAPKGNTLYVRDVSQAASRVQNGISFHVLGKQL